MPGKLTREVAVRLSLGTLFEQLLVLAIVAFFATQWLLPPLQHIIGLAYQGQVTRFIVTNETEAARWFERASTPRTLTDGFARSKFRFSAMLRHGRGVPVDIPRAQTLLEDAAREGYAPALNDLGVRYASGDGVEVDLVRARALYAAAAENNNAFALCNLADFYREGTVLPKDEAKAVALMERSVEEHPGPCGMALAKVLLEGVVVPRDAERGYAVLQAAVRTGDRDAELMALQLKAEGTGTPADKLGAIRQLEALYDGPSGWEALKLAAALGDSRAQALLGAVLIDDANSEREGLEWLAKASNQGNSLAMMTFGEAYEHGKGVAIDTATAVSWYERAAEAGSGDAAAWLAKRARHSGSSGPTATVLAWLERSAREGHSAAQRELAVLLNGKDAQRGYAWATLATADGDTAAQALRDEIEQRLTSEQRLAAQRLAQELVKPSEASKR
jgi:TPR repeat protein